MDEETRALQAQIAALTEAVRALTAKRPARDATFSELAERYGRRASKGVMYYLAPVLEHFGTKLVSSQRRSDFLHYRDELRAKHITWRGTPVSVGTLNLETRVTLAMLRWGVAHEIIDENPFEGVRKLRGERFRETEIDPQAHARAFADAPLVVRVFQAVCIETGMRNGCEVRLMKREHIDRARAVIHVPRANTKGKLDAREVPLSDYLRGLLDQLPPVVGSPYVFANPKTKRPYGYQWLNRQARPYLDRLAPAPGDGRVVTHDSRHSMVSRLHRGGLGSFASLKIVGHRTASQHFRYLHVSDDDRAKAKQLLDDDRRAAHRASRTTTYDENAINKR